MTHVWVGPSDLLQLGLTIHADGTSPGLIINPRLGERDRERVHSQATFLGLSIHPRHMVGVLKDWADAADEVEDETDASLSPLAGPSTLDFNCEVCHRPLGPDWRQCHHERRRFHFGTCGHRCHMCDVDYCITCFPRHQYCPYWHQKKQATSGRVDGGEADDNE
jgi:hypothetical protein